MGTAVPRVSILIPNFNNGKESSKSGQDDLLGNLLRSLWETLKDDPTPFELRAYDDGSTDDSLATLREWSKKRWPNSGEPFLHLTEAEHSGYLSRVANTMYRQARGEFIARLDGDIICLTPRWVTRLCEIFDNGPRNLGVVGPKQLRPDGKIHAYGDFVLHPNGYNHVGSSLPREAVKFPLEVDHIMGCFYCCKKAMWEDIGGYDEEFLRGQTEDLGLRARLKGWSAIAVPNIEFVHFHTWRRDRATEADSEGGISKTLLIFERKWGFSRLAPDLDEVKRRYAGTPLLWNAKVFGEAAEPRPKPPVKLETSEWTRYPTDKALQEWAHSRMGILLDIVRQTGTPRRALLLGAGEGLLPHLLASKGLPCLALDLHASNVDFARAITARQKYPAAAPRFEHMSDCRKIPLEDGAADMLIINDQLELHPNPVALLREAQRVLQPEKLLVVFSRRRSNIPYDPSDPTLPQNASAEHRYLWLELLNQIQAMRAWEFLMDVKSDDPKRDMAVAARRLSEPGPTPEEVTAETRETTSVV